MDNGNEPISRQYQRERRHGGRGKAVALVLILAAAGYGLWWYLHPAEAPAPIVAPPPEPEAPEVQPPKQAEDAAPAQPEEEHHPLKPEADSKGNPPLAPDAEAALEDAVAKWLGKERSLRFVAMDGLSRRIVATIDNLPRHQAASRLWPLFPVGGRMEVLETGSGPQIAPDNAARYNAVVGFVSGIDPVQATALYKRLYPVLQRSYEELGYPGREFNDRLVAVIDHLLQTPEPDKPLALKLVQVQGQVASQQPWLRYEFADSRLQSLSAGQKILLRMGPEHARRIKAVLQAVRAQIATAKQDVK
ncbi:hypothetical protein GCM10010975_02810 [Comamonas phosphati]|nr:hypothetical protein GCM10010975_02810 [Comamonas phosphati]